MKIEIRADGAHLSGYVNVTEKKSRPVITPHGKVVEEIEPRVFERALDRAGEITVTVDHDSSHIYASTRDGTLHLYEDDIGLHADVLITDSDLIEIAKQGKIKGWSFGMYNVRDELEQRAGVSRNEQSVAGVLRQCRANQSRRSAPTHHRRTGQPVSGL